MKKLLLIKLSAMGDVIFTIPLANALTDGGYEVTWLVSEKGYSLIKGNPCVKNVILAPVEKWKKSGNFFKNFAEYLSILNFIRHERFDIAIDTQLIFKSLKWMMFCGAKRKIGAKNYREFANLGCNELIEPTRCGYNPHVVIGYLKYADYLGLKNYNIKVTLPALSDDAAEKAAYLLSGTDNSKPIIIVSPATTWETKHWDKDNWKKLLFRLKDEANIVLTGTKKDEELLSYIDNDYLNLCGKTDLESLRAVLTKADLVISLDSGTTHLAWATQKPKIVSIFCSTPESLYAPLGDKDKYISLSAKNVCFPCHKRKCPKKNNECTLYPSVDDVYKSVIQLIRS